MPKPCVIPRLLITRRYPRIPVRLDGGALCIENVGSHVEFYRGGCDGSYIVVEPYGRVYVGNEDVRPMRWALGSFIQFYALQRGEVLQYEVRLDGRVSFTKFRAGEELLRGLTVRDGVVDEIIKVVEAILGGYLKSSLSIYAAHVRSTLLRDPKVGRVAVRLGDRLVMLDEGVVVVVDSVGSVKAFSIASRVGYVEGFVRAFIEIIRSSGIVHDVRLGRVGQGVRSAIDLFLPRTANKV